MICEIHTNKINVSHLVCGSSQLRPLSKKRASKKYSLAKLGSTVYAPYRQLLHLQTIALSLFALLHPNPAMRNRSGYICDATNCGIGGAHPFTAEFRCIDRLSWVKSEYSNLDYTGNFVMGAARVHAVDGDR
jgi:hypothetical protein